MKKNSHLLTASIIIVNFNGERWLNDCFQSINRQKGVSVETIFVDNCSTDKSVSFVKNNFPNVKIIKSRKNLGFGKANNLGAKLATGEYLIFLNTDTKLHPNCLLNLLGQMESRSVDLAGPKILDFNNLDYYRNRHLTMDMVGTLSWGKKTTIIEGCCLAIKKEVFDKIGKFDERYFMYSEDLDLCWRAWLLGYKISIIKKAVMNHYGGGSSTPTNLGKERHIVPIFRRYETEKNTIRMMIKNATVAHLILALPMMLTLIFLESLLYVLSGQGKAAITLLQAVQWNITNLSDTLLARKWMSENKKRNSIWPLLTKGVTKFTVFKLVGIPKIRFNEK